MSCCGKSTNIHRGRAYMRQPFTAQEAIALNKALRGQQLTLDEWTALRHLRDKIQPTGCYVRRYQVQLCTVSCHWVQIGEDNDPEAAMKMALKHLDPRFSTRIWDSEQLEYVFERKGTEFYTD
jgi:hypothetical protein